ncbi:amidohydrolase [Pseudomonas aeruginosa]|uniref:amidohydrolase family protein n=1 Tax=Pseudomonas aeruginosa TaxID=287 RepID=UPI00053EAD68|nr:amidohydrolase family protein [Pseudomonas aeruginosa]MCO2030144.1 amidohydrolase [Pseudomonas aeruginosa]MCS7675703.1 amidohydrolase [Pseudomonas aeruginosa]MCS7905010.1 amidohydrolase [Pseudomonas aeruginosa]MCS9345773.1 amidohydrolase [Pseudomonas aeruginosa]MCS9358612.1 amidohydrolase [Pseudomonas aeruginosa]
MSIQQGRIDVHHHIIPPVYAEAIYQHGLQLHAGAPLPMWTPEKSLQVMDMNGIQRAITSLTTPGAHLGGGEGQASDLARACNEYAAQLCQQHPERFGSFALLPLPFTEASCAEAIHALDVLKADGLVMFGSSDGVFLGDPSLEELMAELDRRAAVVFVHPNLHQTSEQLCMQAPGFLVEFLCDTTRAAVNLILTGTLERYPHIRWILAHGGGFLPYVAWRVAQADALPQVQEKAPQGVMSYLKRFYFDTALSPSRYSMAALKALVEPTQILFGSDFPFAPAPLTTLQCQTLEENPLWSAEQLYGIHRGHALSLFAQYRQADEVVTPEPIYIDESFSHRMKRSLTRPVGAFVERVRSR